MFEQSECVFSQVYIYTVVSSGVERVRVGELQHEELSSTLEITVNTDCLRKRLDNT
jgi:hypothetical protein